MDAPELAGAVLDGQRKAIGVELAPHHIQVNVIAQNFVDNPTYFPPEVQANPRFQERLQREAKRLEEVGCFAIVLEGIPARLGAAVSRELRVPTIGIGAGVGCDGQVLVTHDLIGLTQGHVPKFVRRYADVAGAMRNGGKPGACA